MKKLPLTFVSLLYLTHAKKDLRVYQGKCAKPGQYPYVVILSFSFHLEHRMCTGSLVTGTWVLTAGHCVESYVDSIRYGDVTVSPWDKRARFSPVLRRIRHPDFSIEELMRLDVLYIHVKNDIGLLNVKRVELPAYGKISGVDYSSLLGYPVTYAGYGLTFLGFNGYMNKSVKELIKKDNHRRLQVGEAVVKKCERLTRNYDFSPVICLAPKCERRQTTIVGDSGGPLFHSGKIVGVLMGGIAEFDNRYTPVSLFLDWIARVIADSQDNDAGRPGQQHWKFSFQMLRETK